MELIQSFSFKLENENKEIIEGVIDAPNSDIAFSKLKKMGLKPFELKFDIGHSIKNLFSTDFDVKDLVRFYKSMSDRINSDKDLIEGIESSVDFIFDKKMRVAALIMASKIKSGEKIYESMIAAGFSKIDAMTIKAAELSGNQGDVFLSLSQENMRKHKLNSDIRSIFMMSIFLIFGMYIGMACAPYVFGLGSERFIQDFNNGKSDFDWYFAIAHFSHDHLIMYVILVIMPIVGIYLAWKKRILNKLMEKWPLWKNLSERNDMSVTWGAFALLYEAGVSSTQCAELVRQATNSDDVKLWFDRLERNLTSGMDMNKSTVKAGFPLYIQRGIKAANSGSSLPEGIKSMAKDLNDDVAALTDVLKVSLTAVSYTVTAFSVLLFIYVVLGPMYLTMFSMM